MKITTTSMYMYRPTDRIEGQSIDSSTQTHSRLLGRTIQSDTQYIFVYLAIDLGKVEVKPPNLIKMA